MRLPLLLSVLFLTACAGAPDSAGSLDLADGPVLPDTQTVDGVLEMRHGADAFDRAPVWTLDTVPMVMIDGGAEFDLSSSTVATVLADGRSAVLSRYGRAELMLFDTAGRPERLLARSGSGPGELTGPDEVIVLPGDTLLVIDESNGMLNWYTADSGFVRGVRRTATWSLSCFHPTGRLADGRFVATGLCSSNRRLPDGSLNPNTQLVVIGDDFAAVDTVAMIPGSRMTTVEVEQGGRKFPAMMWVRFGQPTTVTAVDSTIVVGSGEGGYVLDLRDGSGARTGRIVVDRPTNLMADAMRRTIIEQDIERRMARSERPVTREEARRYAEQEPIADTIAAYQRVTATPNGTIWVLDFILPGDSTWTATAFRRDGAILGRLTGPTHGGMPIWFGDDRVQIRQVDGDGVVRFGVYRIGKE